MSLKCLLTVYWTFLPTCKKNCQGCAFSGFIESENPTGGDFKYCSNSCYATGWQGVHLLQKRSETVSRLFRVLKTEKEKLLKAKFNIQPTLRLFFYKLGYAEWDGLREGHDVILR